MKKQSELHTANYGNYSIVSSVTCEFNKPSNEQGTQLVSQ